MGNYKYENKNYYRQAKDGTWFKVETNDKGQFTWIQPDGKRVYDPHSDQVKIEGEPDFEIVATGFGGVKHIHPRLAQFEQRKYYQNKIADPSENFLNDLVFDTAAGLPKIIYHGGKQLVTGAIDAGKSLIKSVAEKGAKETTKQATKTFVKKGIPTLAVGAVGGVTVDNTSKALTDKTWGENVSEELSKHWGFKVPTIVGDFTNPGYSYGGYAGNKYLSPYIDKVGTNFANLGRYTLNELMPASYALRNFMTLPKIWIKPFYSKPPTFHNGVKPKWYDEFAEKWGIEAAENRFQNGAIWAGIPEEEIPRTMYVRNSDGTYRMTQEGLNVRPDGKLSFPLPDPNDVNYIKDNIYLLQDEFTIGKVGGLHSDYIYRGINPQSGLHIMEFNDVQKINPQWIISNFIKNKFKLNQKNSYITQILNKFGHKNISQLIGYKPFTIKQYYGSDGINLYPYYDDPSSLIIK